MRGGAAAYVASWRRNISGNGVAHINGGIAGVAARRHISGEAMKGAKAAKIMAKSSGGLAPKYL